MRKMSKKNKLSFNLFGVLIVLLLGCFGFFAYQVMAAPKESYEVAQGCAVYDEKMQPIDMAASGTVQKKWDQKYYLTLANGETYCLGAQSVIFNPASKQVDIIGKGYQIFTDGSVANISGKTEIPRSANVMLYKLADRKYLLVGNEIFAKDQDFSASNYLQVNLDKAGNALLTNDQVNMKTVEPLVLLCNELEFDIANETLHYQEQMVDLKAVGGSSNEYVKPSPSPSPTEEAAPDASSSVVNNNNNQNNTTNNNQQNNTLNGGGTEGGASATPKPSSSANKNLERSISLRGTSADVSGIQVDYAITDVENKFVSAYLLVQQVGMEEETRIELNKADTSVQIRDLSPNTQYRITLCYDMYLLIDGENTRVTKTENTMKVRTKSIYSDIEVTKMTSKSLSVMVRLDPSYVLERANLALYTDNGVQKFPVDIKKACREGWSFEIDIAGVSTEEYRLVLEDALYQGGGITLNAECITKSRGVTNVVRNGLDGAN